MGPQPDQAQMHFSPKVDYILILDKLREDFNKKFAVNVPSPSTGLDDYDVKATLGSGSFGKVQLVREKDPNSKCIKRPLPNRPAIENRFANSAPQRKAFAKAP